MNCTTSISDHLERHGWRLVRLPLGLAWIANAEHRVAIIDEAADLEDAARQIVAQLGLP